MKSEDCKVGVGLPIYVPPGIAEDLTSYFGRIDIPPQSQDAVVAELRAENERLKAKVRELRGYYEDAMKCRDLLR